MTPEQLEILTKQRWFTFFATGEQYTFETEGGPFVQFKYIRQFQSLAEVIAHAKTVVATCGGNWGQSEGVDQDSWITDNIRPSGCIIIVVCDPTLYEIFLKSEGVQVDLSPYLQRSFPGPLTV